MSTNSEGLKSRLASVKSKPYTFPITVINAHAVMIPVNFRIVSNVRAIQFI